jgi:hypothetical protein
MLKCKVCTEYVVLDFKKSVCVDEEIKYIRARTVNDVFNLNEWNVRNVVQGMSSAIVKNSVMCYTTIT